KKCVFKIFDSNDAATAGDTGLEGDEWKDVAVDCGSLGTGIAVFDDCEFTNITVDHAILNNQDGGGVIRVGYIGGGPEGTAFGIARFNRSKITGITVKKNMDGTNAVRGGVMLMGHSANNDVKLINTIIADNILYDNNSNGAQGGLFCMTNAGDLQLINCTVVNNQIITNYSWGSGSVIFADDYNNDGYAPHFTVFNSIIHSNTITINAGTPSESHSQIDQFRLTEFNDGTEVYASYSLIGGDDDLGGDDILLNVEPEFLDSTYALHARSTAIGAGAVESEDAEGNTIYAPTVDIAGNIRPNPA
ncbi:uncharacterized protein METZ01_LOCUS372193, partial [marine metagenome]